MPLEAFALGGGVITSRVQGIKDSCKKPLEGSSPEGEFFNIFNFTCIAFDRVSNNIEKTLSNMIEKVNFGLKEWSKLNTRQQENAQIRWIHEAEQFEWNLKNGPIDKYIEIYLHALKTETAEESLLRDHFIRSYLQ